ncbi:MAG: class I SAM-dependent rRNA methyltransferase [Solobacterium sp.]|nr:class I SAM-dependent rRNA methyltransferase [Solobacterium sp.]
MKKERSFPYVKVTKKQEARIKDGHLWVYGEEITEASETIENGAVTDVFGTKGNYLGSGFWSEHSLIRVRILSDNANEAFDDAYFQRKVSHALQYRRDVMGEDYTACRLIHGDADGLPGLTVDRYNDLLSTEITSYGTEMRKDVIFRAIIDELKKDGVTVRGIYERNESPLRSKEGLERYKGWYKDIHPEKADTVICENGILYHTDLENGQKTGFFLDQKYNRLAVRRIAAGKKVLDCCTHIGSFALNAAKGGAKEVTALDISAAALANAQENARLNGLDVNFIEADVFEALQQMIASHEKYDLIILDPPAFTKSRQTSSKARNGYRRINAMAMRLLPRGGYLASCSCSHFMPKEEFRKMLCDAAKDAGVRIRLIEEKGAAPDHPVLPTVPETEYLKFFLLQII